MSTKLVWLHCTAGASMLIYPWYLMKHQNELQLSSKKYWLLTASVFSFIMGIYPKYYIKDTSISGGLRFGIAQMITQWAMKILQINTLGNKYFTSRNITKNWQIIIDCLIPAKIEFGYDKNNNTRKKSLYQLLEILFNGSIIFISSKLMAKENYTAYKPVLGTLQFTSFICIQGNVLAFLLSLILGNNIKSIEYAYQFPIRSINLQSFWKRWSTHFGRCLKECVYIPCGGKYNYVYSMSMTGIVCTAQHMIVNYMISGDLKVIEQSKTFGVVYGGTIIDGLIGRFNNKDKSNLFINISRYIVMIGTFAAMFLVQPNPSNGEQPKK